MSEKITETQAAYQLGLIAAGERHIELHPYLVNSITGAPESLEKLLPAPIRKKEHRQFRITADFVSYLNRFKGPESSIYVSGWTVLAEIDHRNSNGELVWGDHSAQITFEPTTAMKRWIDSSGKALSQQDFADLIEERAGDISHPDSASMLEIAQALHVTKNSAVSSVTRQGVNHHITFSDEQKVRGGNDADIPSRFEIRLKPFIGSQAVLELGARLRVSMRSEKPMFVYELQDYQERMLETIHEQVSEIAQATELPAYI
ncbi:MAG: DUF2303 family protein [Terrimicrobiaceae bacterium]